MTDHHDRMDRSRWDRLEALCHSALEQEPAERAAYLDRACAGDASLRRDAERLLEQLASDPAFLERPLVDLSDLGRSADPVAGTIGSYVPVRRLGRGGMGEVYLAVREAADVRQQVAVKVIRPGKDTDEVLRRFRLERRILASLNHPNIARLLDAGATTDGRPYFVMEYVDGQTIDAYCAERAVPLRGRLALFQVVCNAVQHAHQSLVVHRDLKPSNILVDAGGTPKLLDFGIGKVLGDTDAFGSAVETRAGGRPVTPAYAAPEQLAGGTVTTATDVHALGVLLYELLTGRHPFAVAADAPVRDVERAVLETAPAAPSTVAARTELRRRLAGDLDNIILKALRKEPERRYPSAAALADDIRRHLDGLPVTARPDTLGYRVRKFVRRNAGWVAAAAAVFLALSATTAVTLVQSRRVAREAARVARERDKALEVRGFLMEMFGATGADRAVGDSVTARQLLDLQAARLDVAYDQRPDLKAEMLEVLADGYDRLGLYDAAEPLARRALAIRREAAGDDHPDLASSLNLYGWVLHEQGKSRDAEPLLREAVTLRRSAGPDGGVGLSRSLNDLGVIVATLGRPAEAETLLAEALDLRSAAFDPDHRSVGITANNLAVAFYHQSKLDDAVRAQQTAVEALARSVGPDHQRSVMALNNLATFKAAQGNWEGAERDYRALLERQSRIQGRQHPFTAQILRSLGSAVAHRAGRAGDPEGFAEAEALLVEAVAIAQTHLGPTHPEVGAMLADLVGILGARGKPREAIAAQERALRIIEGAYGASHPSTARALTGLAGLRWGAGEGPAALALQRRAIATLDGSLGPAHGETARARATLCDWLLYVPSGQPEALQTCARAVDALATLPEDRRPALTRSRLRLAQAHLSAGDRSAAESLVQVVRAAGAVAPGDAPLLDSLIAALAPGN